MHLIVGLGNPGPEYAATRHNLGYWVVAELAARWRLRLSRHSLESRWGQGRVGGEQVVLAQPTTYMNLSGRAVARLLRYFKLSPEALVVVHDDLDVPFGRLKIVNRGGPGGHRGVLSVMAELDTEEFLRLKLGVGRPPPEVSPEDYVLSPFSPEETPQVPELVARAASAVETLLAEGLAAAQNRFHGEPV
jgi:PTH1 family peptidyl-tRNA hydrolase